MYGTLVPASRPTKRLHVDVYASVIVFWWVVGVPIWPGRAQLLEGEAGRPCGAVDRGCCCNMSIFCLPIRGLEMFSLAN